MTAIAYAVLIGACSLWAWAVYDPGIWPFSVAVAYTLLVFWPILWRTQKGE
jgi:hypothetical protein